MQQQQQQQQQQPTFQPTFLCRQSIAIQLVPFGTILLNPSTPPQQ